MFQEDLNKCIEISFGGKYNYDVGVDDNYLLAKEREEFLLSGGTPYYPSFVINGVFYRGNL